jgi:hypothetical protein
VLSKIVEARASYADVASRRVAREEVKGEVLCSINDRSITLLQSAYHR